MMHIREFFYMTKSDRSVLLVLLLMGLVSIVLLYGLGGGLRDTSPGAADGTRGERLAAGGETRGDGYGHRRDAADDGGGYYAVATTAPERFVFDPNTADSTQLLRLGLQPWQVRNIYKYRARGGIYRQPSDFARLYGLTQKQYRELEPYIRISDDYRPAAELFGNAPREYGRGTAGAALADDATPAAAPDGAEGRSEGTAVAARRAGYPVKLHPGEHVVLNLADTTQLKTVPGIGSYFARRISDYGRRLGGYVSVAQLKEIEGFPEESLPYFEVAVGEVEPMNVNVLPLSKLRQHPYLNYYQARAITDYRRLHGRLSSLDNLRLLPEFPADVLERLRPYVSF